MFGTLVLCLSSPHEGGEVIMKHCGRTMMFKSSDYQQSVVSW